MVRMEIQVQLDYEVGNQGADFIFNLHAAYTARQTVVAERLLLSQPVDAPMHTEPATGNRCLRLRAAPGPLTLSYAATIDLAHEFADPAQLGEVPVSRLPANVLGYLYPSRYCQSDRLIKFAIREFGGLRQGHSRVQAIQQWVQQRVSFTPNTSNSNTSAVDTLVEQVGVCRDFAHLMIALCRAVNIPARFASGAGAGWTTHHGRSPTASPMDCDAATRWPRGSCLAMALPTARLSLRSAPSIAWWAWPACSLTTTGSRPTRRASSVQWIWVAPDLAWPLSSER